METTVSDYLSAHPTGTFWSVRRLTCGRDYPGEVGTLFRESGHHDHCEL
jgi:hypothetical protein